MVNRMTGGTTLTVTPCYQRKARAVTTEEKRDEGGGEDGTRY